MKFRSDINGLRAIAVIGVVLFHFNEIWLPGGFAGVDIFFVISGYLMAGIISTKLYKNDFQIIGFYLGRLKRIVPALAVLCLALIVYSWFNALDAVFEQVSWHTLSSLTFLSNMVYLQESGYFDSSAYDKWLLHTWSLSVEFQFYILYPIVLWMTHKIYKGKYLGIVTAFLAIISFLLGIVVTAQAPDKSYFLLPTRAWSLLIGSLVFFYPLKLNPTLSKITELAGIGLIIASYIFISNKTPWPGYMAFIPCLGAVLILQANRNESLITGNAVFQKIGLWSYSIYLWHWPLVVYFYSNTIKTPLNYAFFITLCVILGAISYTFIERKFKPLYAAILYASLLVASYIAYANHGHFDQRLRSMDPRNEIINKYKNYELDPEHYFDYCNAAENLRVKGINFIDTEKCISSVQGGVLLWGDSHLASLAYGVRHFMKENVPNTPYSQITSSGCVPSFTFRRTGKWSNDVGCNYSNDQAKIIIPSLKPEIVILAIKGQHENYNWNETIEQLHSYGVKKVIIIGPFPQWNPSLSKAYVLRHMGETKIKDITFDLSLLKSNDHLKELSKANDSFIFINILENICTISSDQNQQPLCLAKIGDDLITFDYGHLTTSASKYITEHFLKLYLMDFE